MTTKDKQNIRSLYYFYRYTQGSISRLYGLSQQRISVILLENKYVFVQEECLLCGNDDAVKSYFIDGNENNTKPSNIIVLCEMDKRRIEHLQIRRTEKTIIAEY